jgi:capsular polysaccharide biosynthesis protein
MENLAPVADAEDEISLLDLLLTVSQNIKLLILGPLAAGLCALGVTFTLPATYESVAILPTNINSTLRLAAVLDPVVVKLDLTKGKTPEQARLELNGRIKYSQDKQTKLYTLTVSGDSPQQAQATAKALLKQSYEQNRPRGSNKTRLEVQLVGAK